MVTVAIIYPHVVCLNFREMFDRDLNLTLVASFRASTAGCYYGAAQHLTTQTSPPVSSRPVFALVSTSLCISRGDDLVMGTGAC